MIAPGEVGRHPAVTAPDDPVAFARGIPKAEIHLHLEGSVGPDTLAEVLRRAGGGAIDPDALRPLYHHHDFRHFLQNFRELCGYLRRPHDFAIITEALSRRLQQDGVQYAEVMCSPTIFTRAGLPLSEMMDAVSAAARRRTAEGGPRLRFLFDGVRQFGPESLQELVEMAGACRHYDVIGVGLGGDERSLPAAVFADAYREARRRGLRTTMHAGEFDGPRSVWEALETLQVDRIGHGIRAVEDPLLVQALARRRVPLECCPSSNLGTGVVRAWSAHPLRRLHDAGVVVTVSSDDPALFGSSVAEEWGVLETRLGFSRSEVLEIGRRTVEATFLQDDDKRELCDAMRRAAAVAQETA
jgi:aminodeoxyfutalosine deaminase